MKIEYPFKDGRCEVAISEEADRRLFNGIADAILSKFNGTLVERLDGFDERYWDIAINDSVVTLHLQHYLGISLLSDNVEANDLIREIGEYLEGVKPKRLFREWFYIKNAFRIRRRDRTKPCS